MAGANHFALLESDDPGDTRVDDKNHQQPAPSLAQELFGRAYPSAQRIIRSREIRHQNGGAGPANARDGGPRKKKNAQQGGAKKQGSGGANGAAVDDEAAAPKLYDLNQFPSLK